jgi:hypothetical protein
MEEGKKRKVGEGAKKKKKNSALADQQLSMRASETLES